MILKRKITGFNVKERNKIRFSCVCKCNHMFVCAVVNNAVICLDDTVQRHSATSRKVAGSIPDGVTGSLH
jgi:hypothetical protein